MNSFWGSVELVSVPAGGGGGTKVSVPAGGGGGTR